MKLLIASDIHGSALYCREILYAYDRENAEKMLLLGDLLYHGPRNDLPEEYAPKKVIEMLNKRKETILCVRGNCDTEVDQMVLDFPILADYALLVMDGVRIYATHGHVYHTGYLPPLQAGDVLLHGHTHVPCWEYEKGVQILNPGSVSIPKGNSTRGYMTLENGLFIWKELDGREIHRLKITDIHHDTG